MGAEVVSRTPDIHLAETSSSSFQSKTNNADDDENDTSSSTTTSDQTTERTSSADTNESSSSEFRSDCDDDINSIKYNGKYQEEKMFKILSHGNEVMFRSNIFAFLLVPAALIPVWAFFEASPLISIGSVDSVTSFTLALAGNMSDWYMTVLEGFPVLTKSLTTGIVQFFGDYAAQRYEQQNKNDASSNEKERAYDLRRGLSLFCDGLLLSGPLLHYCFEWMEEIWPTGGDEVITLATLCHVFVNDYIIDSIYIGLSFVFTGVVEGYTLGQVAEIFRKDYGATVRASWLTSLGLIPVEIWCFGYLSLSFRVLAMNFVDLLWGAIVSFYSHRSRRENPGAKKCKEK